MKKYFFLILLFFGLVSCNSTKRAEKRIYNIVENNPELTHASMYVYFFRKH